MLIANAVLADGTKRHIDVKGGRIAALLPDDAGVPLESEVLDVAGALLLPPLVDGHIHLDKTLLGLPWLPNQADWQQGRGPHRGRAQGPRRPYGAGVRNRLQSRAAGGGERHAAHAQPRRCRQPARPQEPPRGPENPRALPGSRHDPDRGLPAKRRRALAGHRRSPECRHRRGRRPGGRPRSRRHRRRPEKPIWTRSSASPSGAVLASTSTCTTAARAASRS